MAQPGSTITFGDSNSGLQAGFMHRTIHTQFNLPPAIPVRRRIPPSSPANIPFPRNTSFIDRGTLLNQISEQCNGPASQVALVGPSRVGKSQLAIEHCYRTLDRFPNSWVFWVHADNASNFSQSFWTIADQVNLPGRDHPGVGVFDLVYGWLSEHRNWLLVLDDVGSNFILSQQLAKFQHLLSIMLLQGLGGSILITTQTIPDALWLVRGENIIQIEPVQDADERASPHDDFIGTPQDVAEQALPRDDFIDLSIGDISTPSTYPGNPTYSSAELSVSERSKRRIEMEDTMNEFKLGFSPNWQLHEEIGSGGFGRVFRVASPEGDGQVWAVKRIVKREPRIEPEKDFIIREIVTSATLTRQQNQCFVKFFGWNEDNLDVYFAMEYIPLGDLEKNLTSAWAEDDTKVTIQQLLCGLAIMHSHHITHRDLKPRNIFLVSRDPVHVKIGDFGISKRVPEGSSTCLNTRFSTQGYSAPETTLEDQHTSAVDLWSLGCVLYRMISGTRLFKRDLDAAIWSEDDIMKRLGVLLFDNISLDGFDLMRKLLIKNPEHRITAVAALEHAWLSLD